MRRIQNVIILGCLLLVSSCGSKQPADLVGRYHYSTADKKVNQALYVCRMGDTTYQVTLQSEVVLSSGKSRKSEKNFTGKFYPESNTMDIGDGVVLHYIAGSQTIKYGDGDFVKKSDDCTPAK